MKDVWFLTVVVSAKKGAAKSRLKDAAGENSCCA